MRTASKARALAVELADEAVWPRTPEYRFRLYGRIGTDLRVLAAAPDAGGIGQAIVTLHADQKAHGARLADLGQTGLLDVIAGDWIILPWSRPEGTTTFGRQPREVDLG